MAYELLTLWVQVGTARCVVPQLSSLGFLLVKLILKTAGCLAAVLSILSTMLVASQRRKKALPLPSHAL